MCSFLCLHSFATFLGFDIPLFLCHLLPDSVESLFLRVGVLPLGRVCSVGCFLCVFLQCLYGLCPHIHCPLSVLVVSPLSFWSLSLGVPASAAFAMGPSPSLFSCGIAPSSHKLASPFFSFFALQCLHYGCFLQSIVPAVAVVLLYSRLLCCVSFLSVWRWASGKFPTPPAVLRLQFFSTAIGHCAWRLHLSPLVHCVHGNSTDSSQPYRTLRLAPPSIPSGPLCPWNIVACPLPYRLL